MNHSKPGRSQHVPAFVMHLESSFSATNFDRDMKSWCIETMAAYVKSTPHMSMSCTRTDGGMLRHLYLPINSAISMNIWD